MEPLDLHDGQGAGEPVVTIVGRLWAWAENWPRQPKAKASESFVSYVPPARVFSSTGHWPTRARVIGLVDDPFGSPVHYSLTGPGVSPTDACSGDSLTGPHGEEFARVAGGWWYYGGLSPERYLAVAVAGVKRPDVDGPVCWLPDEHWTRPAIGYGYARADVDTLIERGH